MSDWIFRLVILALYVAAVYAVICGVRWVFGFRGSPERSRLAVVVGVLFGMESLLYISGGFLFFLAGLGLTDVAIDAFWPQCNNVVWIRPVAGCVSLVVYLVTVEVVRKVLR
jgi:hypothetical protein